MYSLFESVKLIEETDDVLRLDLEGALSIAYFRRSEVIEFEWVASPKADLMADSFLLAILQITEHPTPAFLHNLDAITGNDGSKKELAYKDFKSILIERFDGVCEDEHRILGKLR